MVQNEGIGVLVVLRVIPYYMILLVLDANGSSRRCIENGGGYKRMKEGGR